MRKTILVVDDDELCPLVLPRLFKTVVPELGLACVENGQEAISYLLGDGKYSDRSQYPLPSLILLDLKMPRVSGFEVLEWKNQQSAVKSIPVVVWSSSDLKTDVDKARSLGALSFVVKPGKLQDTGKILESLKDYLANGMN